MVEVIAKVKNYNNQTSVAQKNQAPLYDGAKVFAKSASIDVPALKAGEEKTITLIFPAKNPKKWTAETLNLYTTVVELKGAEIISTRTGFRKIEIKARVFMVNDVPVKLKGLNRHEHSAETGHVVTEAQMIPDLEDIKQGNCNNVRTSHYTNDPRWYHLCNEYGIFLVAEANVECHGLSKKYKNYTSRLAGYMERMKSAIIDRNVANVENLKITPRLLFGRWAISVEIKTEVSLLPMRW